VAEGLKGISGKNKPEIKTQKEDKFFQPKIVEPIMSPADRAKRLNDYFQKPGITKIDISKLVQVENSIKDFDDYVKNAKSKVTRKQNALRDLGLTSRVDEFLNSKKETFKDLLVNEAQEAFENNEDLKYPPWRAHLVKKLRKDGLIEIIPTPSPTGDRVLFEVNILDNLRRILGTIQDYTDAVKATRDRLEYGYKVSGKLATHLWYSRLWLPGRLGTDIEMFTKLKKSGKLMPLRKKKKKGFASFYKTIMKVRLEEMSEMAPYWELLNAGAIDLPGNKGGYAKPAFAPSWFVLNAETSIKNFIESRFDPSTRATKEIEMEGEIEAAKQHLYELQEVRELLRDVVTSLSHDNLYSISIEKAMISLNLSFASAINRARNSENLSKITLNKIEIFANQIIANQESSKRLYFWTSARAVSRARTQTARVRLDLQRVKENTPPPSEAMIQLAKKRIEELQREIKILQAKERGSSR